MAWTTKVQSVTGRKVHKKISRAWMFEVIKNQQEVINNMASYLQAAKFQVDKANQAVEVANALFAKQEQSKDQRIITL